MTATTPKGESRRVAVLDAVIRVPEAGGPAAVTHLRMLWRGAPGR